MASPLLANFRAFEKAAKTESASDEALKR